MAILNNRVVLMEAIAELHAHFLVGMNPPRRGIVFRVISEGERDGINYRLHNHAGVEGFAEAASVFNVGVGNWHLINNHHLAHIWNRHSDPRIEEIHGQIPVTRDDLCQIPEVIDPRNITDFRMAGGMARIVCRRTDERGALVAVEEIRRKDGLVMKTLYRQKS